MIQDSLAELELLVDEDCKFDLPKQLEEILLIPTSSKGNGLIKCLNDTINEADEKDEEETLFDKEGNTHSARSMNKELNIENLILNEKKYARINVKDFSNQSPMCHIIPDCNASIESESIKFEEDLLNDSIKFEENIFYLN